MKKPTDVHVRIRDVVVLIAMAVIVALIVAWAISRENFAEAFPRVITLLGMAVTAATVVWPWVASFFHAADAEAPDSPRSLTRATKTVTQSLAVAGPILAALGVGLDDKLGMGGLLLSCALGLVLIPLMLAWIIMYVPSMHASTGSPATDPERDNEGEGANIEGAES